MREGRLKLVELFFSLALLVDLFTPLHVHHPSYLGQVFCSGIIRDLTLYSCLPWARKGKAPLIFYSGQSIKMSDCTTFGSGFEHAILRLDKSSHLDGLFDSWKLQSDKKWRKKLGSWWKCRTYQPKICCVM